MAWVWAVMAVLWAVHLLFGQVRLRDQMIKNLRERIKAQAEEQDAVLEALSKRIEALEVENDVQRGIMDGQANFIKQNGFSLPVLAYRNDGSSFPQDFVIHEEP